jgi:putative lipoic acid-binding regulatory protein
MTDELKLPAEPKLPALELLKEHHTFPGPFTFKIIMDEHANAESDVRNQLENVVPASRIFSQIGRRSSKGNHVSFSVILNADSAEEVHSVYRELLKLKGLRALF